MSDNADTDPQVDDTTTEPPKPTPPAKPAAPQSQRVEDLPDWAQAIVREARTEAGKYRREKSSTETALSELQKEIATLREGSEDVTAELTASRLAETRLKAALRSGQTGEEALEFAARLQGTTEEEISADAEKLAKFFNASPAQQTPRSDPSQGAQPITLNGDPLESALRDHLGIA